MRRFLLLLLLLLLPAITYAQVSDLLISEYIEGSSNNKAIELFNGTGSAVNLAAGQYVIQMYFNGSSSAGLTVNLAGTVASGDVFVLAHASAAAAILAQADQTNSASWFNGDDAIVLRRGGATGTIVDVIGQVGNDPGTEWGTGLASTADNTLRRKAGACTGDGTATDAFDPSAGFDGFAQDDFSGLGSHSAECAGEEQAPSVGATVPASGATGISAGANITITFSEDVNVSGSWFTIRRQGGDEIAAAATGGPRIFTLDPSAQLQEGAVYEMTIHAAGVSDQDGNDPPDGMAADYSFSFTVASAAAITKISAVQGSGSSTPIPGQTVTIEGIVVGDFQTGDGDQYELDGFYVQEEPADYDASQLTSEGIFVFATGGTDVRPGDVVRVTGVANEYVTSSGASSLTQLRDVSLVSIVGTASLPAPADISLPVSSLLDFERYEGMLVRFPQELLIAEYFDFDRYGEIVLARPLDGMQRPFTPTSYARPGAAANQAAQANTFSRIKIDDGRGDQNPDPLRHPNGANFTTGNRFRGGDLVGNAVGVMDDRFGTYRIQPTAAAAYTPANPRAGAPEEVGGSLKVSSFNVLNYFLTIDNGRSICGPGSNQECRGADTQEEFVRQRTKILNALAEINADVFGLIELENTAGVEPLADIVGGLNERLGAGTYSSITTGTIGTDAIKVGIIYKPSVVTPKGGYAILNSAADARFIDTKNRPSLAQSFTEISSGGVFTVVVNHLKSKGSDCNDIGDPDLGDGQGNCNRTRRLAAEALVDWLAGDPTGSGDPDFLIIGDLNAYDEEEPIDAIRAGADGIAGTADDFVDLIEKYHGEFAYSYVFDGQLGYLDYALASSGLSRQATGAADWHINADEPDVIDYDMSFKKAAQDALYEPVPYRSADHDPVIVGLNVGPQSGRRSLSGAVVGTADSPVAGATITVDGDESLVVTTDTSGRFIFSESLAPGYHSVTVSASGFHTATFDLAMPDENKQVVLGLIPSDVPPPMPPFTVCATVTAASGSGPVLSGVTVEILQSENVVQQTVTDARGTGCSAVLQAGSYQVRFSKPGYQTLTADLELNANKRIVISLIPSNLE